MVQNAKKTVKQDLDVIGSQIASVPMNAYVARRLASRKRSPKGSAA